MSSRVVDQKAMCCTWSVSFAQRRQAEGEQVMMRQRFMIGLRETTSIESSIFKIAESVPGLRSQSQRAKKGCCSLVDCLHTVSMTYLSLLETDADPPSFPGDLQHFQRPGTRSEAD